MNSDIIRWLLYRPGSTIDDEERFTLRKEDRVIKDGFPVQSERRSADTVVEVVILIAHEPDYHTLNHPPTKKRIEYEFAAIGKVKLVASIRTC